MEEDDQTAARTTLDIVAEAARLGLIGHSFARDAEDAATMVKELLKPGTKKAATGKVSRQKFRDPALRRSPAMPPKPWPAIARRNLIFYILPLKHRERVWQWHVEQLRRYLPLFNGRKIVTIATPTAGNELAIEPAAAVRAEFGRLAKSIEFLERPNDQRCWEAPALAEMLGMIRSTAVDEATFYFHAKGVRRADQSAIRPWCEAIYHWNLEQAERAIQSLRSFKACGIALNDVDPTGVVHGAGEWHFSGNGFWVRHDALFRSPGWRDIQDHTHAAEAYLSRLFRRDEVRCLKDVDGCCYNPATWQTAAGKDQLSEQVSIMVTARNYGRFLRDCLESCFWQMRPALEVIYCDDGSEDDSLAIAERFKPQGLEILALRERRGVEAARNIAASKSRGSLLLFVDADNILPRNYLAEMVARINHWTTFVYPDLAFFGEETYYLRQPKWQDFELWVGNHCDTCSLIRRDAFFAAGGWMPGPWAHMADYHLFLRLSCFGRARRAGVALGYRRHGGSMTTQMHRDNDPAEMQAAVERIRADVTRWAIERFGRLPSRKERDLGVTAAAPRELANARP